MALEVKETSGVKLTGRPGGGYSTTAKTKGGQLKLNDDTGRAVPGTFKASLPQKQSKGLRATGQGRPGGRSTPARVQLSGRPRVMVPITGANPIL